MKTVTKEQENSLINQMLDLEEQLHFTEMKEQFCKDSSERTTIESTRKNLKESLDKVSNDLIEIETSLASLEIKDYLIRAFYQMTAAISNVQYDFPISRSQSMIFDNYFASKILNEINRTMNGDFHDLASPFLHFTTDPKDFFDRKQLISFFGSEIGILKNINPVNYVILKSYYKEFANRLLKLIEK